MAEYLQYRKNYTTKNSTHHLCGFVIVIFRLLACKNLIKYVLLIQYVEIETVRIYITNL